MVGLLDGIEEGVAGRARSGLGDLGDQGVGLGPGLLEVARGGGERELSGRSGGQEQKGQEKKEEQKKKKEAEEAEEADFLGPTRCS